MKVMLQKRATGLVPATDKDAEIYNALRIGDYIYVEYRRPRNPQHHRKMMALLRIVLENQEKYATIEHVLLEIKLRLGWYEEHVRLSGEVILVPKSIAFASMDQDTFALFYNRTVTVVLEEFLVGMTGDELDAAVDEVLRFA